MRSKGNDENEVGIKLKAKPTMRSKGNDENEVGLKLKAKPAMTMNL